MTTVNFMISSRGKSEAEARTKLTEVCEKLKAVCAENALELQDARFINSGRILEWESNDWQGRYDFQIIKRKGVTYNEIYRLVNSVQVVPFSIVRNH